MKSTVIHSDTGDLSKLTEQTDAKQHMTARGRLVICCNQIHITKPVVIIYSVWLKMPTLFSYFHPNVVSHVSQLQLWEVGIFHNNHSVRDILTHLYVLLQKNELYISLTCQH